MMGHRRDKLACQKCLLAYEIRFTKAYLRYPTGNEHSMRDFEVRNAHFDKLVNTPGLKWLGQNTNHIPAHPLVLEAMIKFVRDEEFHVYAPPAGLQALRAGSLSDMGPPQQSGLGS